MLKEIPYEDNLPIKVQVLEIDKYPWHIHNDIQIIYVLEGEIELKLAYAKYKLVKNNIHIVHYRDVHGFKAISKKNLVLILSLNTDYFSKSYPNLIRQIFFTQVGESLATYKKQLGMTTLIFSIISELHNKKEGYKKRATDYSFKLVDILYEEFRGFSIDPKRKAFQHKITHDPSKVDRISHVISYIYENYPYKISLAEVAKINNINSYYLSHLFQNLVGTNFRDFISMVRAELSEADLLTTDFSITQISHNVGFSNSRYYISSFKKWFGCTPKEYRQLYKQEILGLAPMISNELPLDSINSIIPSYKEFPVFSGADSEVKSAIFNLKNYLNNYQDKDAKLYSPKVIYREYNPQKHAMEALKNFLKNPNKEERHAIIMDNPQSNSGLLTVNNMKKPVYYVHGFINEQFKEICQSGSWYVITRRGSNFKLLFFNESSNKTHDFDFSFFHTAGNYQVTEHVLSPKHSCLEYWKGLNFNKSLREETKKKIEKMSSPEIRFKSISSSDSFIYSATLDPEEIFFVEIDKI